MSPAETPPVNFIFNNGSRVEKKSNLLLLIVQVKKTTKVEMSIDCNADKFSHPERETLCYNLTNILLKSSFKL